MKLKEIFPAFQVTELKRAASAAIFEWLCSSNLLPVERWKDNGIDDLGGTRCILRKFADDTELLKWLPLEGRQQAGENEPPVTS